MSCYKRFYNLWELHCKKMLKIANKNHNLFIDAFHLFNDGCKTYSKANENVTQVLLGYFTFIKLFFLFNNFMRSSTNLNALDWNLL